MSKVTNETMHSIIDDFKSQGFEVYAPENLSSYIYIVQGNNIAYAQFSTMNGLEFTSVHKPCSHAGTGYKCETLEQALGYRPWWGQYQAGVIKYKNFAEYQAKHWQTLKQY